MVECDKCKFKEECDSKRVLDKYLEPYLKAIIEDSCNQFEEEVK